MGIRSNNSKEPYYNSAGSSGGEASVGAKFIATGGKTGTYTDADGDWKFHAFLYPNSDKFSVTSGEVNIQYLVVGGGGGGANEGSSRGGGGGAGG